MWSCVNCFFGLWMSHTTKVLACKESQMQTSQYLNYKILISIWLGLNGYRCFRYYLTQLYHMWKAVYFRKQPFCKFSLCHFLCPPRQCIKQAKWNQYPLIFTTIIRKMQWDEYTPKAKCICQCSCGYRNVNRRFPQAFLLQRVFIHT